MHRGGSAAFERRIASHPRLSCAIWCRGLKAHVSGLSDARAKAKLTQSELARRMGTTQSAIARLESGRAVPSGATLLKFAKAVGRRLSVQFR